MTRKSYGQYCGLAKALDHVGDRWTLLIVRELLIGPRRYSTLRSALPGIATNLLGDRLTQLAEDGLVTRDVNGYYELTEAGAGLEDAVHALVRWGGIWMHERSATEIFEPQWLVVALRALLPARRRGWIELRTEGETIHIGPRSVGLGPASEPVAVVEGPPDAILAVAAGAASISTLKVRGDQVAAARVLRG